MRKRTDFSLFDPRITMPALKSALVKFKPRSLSKNPVMFVTAVVAALSTLLFVRDAAVGAGTASVAGQIAAWLWFTVYFANFAEALAEGRGKARACRSSSPAVTALPSKPKPCRAATSGRATSCWSRRATSCRRTARWSKVSRRSTNPRSQANPPR